MAWYSLGTPLLSLKTLKTSTAQHNVQRHVAVQKYCIQPFRQHFVQQNTSQCVPNYYHLLRTLCKRRCRTRRWSLGLTSSSQRSKILPGPERLQVKTIKNAIQSMTLPCYLKIKARLPLDAMRSAVANHAIMQRLRTRQFDGRRTPVCSSCLGKIFGVCTCIKLVILFFLIYFHRLNLISVFT